MESVEPGCGIAPSPTDTTPVTGAEVVAAIEAQASYLRIALGAPAADGWIAASDLLGDPDLLVASIRSTAAGRGAPDDQVAASLWFQAYAFRAALPVLAPLALGIEGLSADPADTHIRIARHRPAAIAVTSVDLVARSAGEAAADLFDGHLRLVIDAVSDAVRVGQRLLWGNAAASCATVLRALDGAPGADRAAVQRCGEAFVQASPWIHGLGNFDKVVEGDQVGWFWTRTNCCLWDRCEGAARCDDCSFTSAPDLDASRRAGLRRQAEEVAS